jgi:vacuolar-type H+-ATPase subunit D/Vma8
MKIKE